MPPKRKMSKENNDELRIDPCGTPQISEAVIDGNMLTQTEKVRLIENQSNAEPEIPAKTLIC